MCKRPEGRCVALASLDCTVLADPRVLESDDAVWFGSMFPTTGEGATEFGLGEVRDPLRASSRGLGELVVAALDAGPRALLVCLGGVATVDGAELGRGSGASKKASEQEAAREARERLSAGG